MKNYKPTSASRRNYSVVDYAGVSANNPVKALTKRLRKNAGRNNQGRITTRHQGGGNKIIYRTVDFNELKKGVPGRVEAIEYDPYRTAFIARISDKDGARRYVLAPQGLAVGSIITSGPDAPLTIGNRTSLSRIPVGSFVYNVELIPGGGGRIARSAGTSVQILSSEDGVTQLKLSSGEVRRVSWTCQASIGQVSNQDHNLVIGGKAGRSRWLGIRPTVRGKVMNPRDHPYGGGEGRTQRGTRRPKTKWGKITGGRRTRRASKWSNSLIVKRRK